MKRSGSLPVKRKSRFHKPTMPKGNCSVNSIPCAASYTVKMQVNSMEYTVKIQPEEECCVAALQALLIEREDDGPSFELVTESPLLASLLELLVFQGMRQAL